MQKEILSDEPKLIELYKLGAANKGHCLPIILFAKVCKGRRGWLLATAAGIELCRSDCIRNSKLEGKGHCPHMYLSVLDSLKSEFMKLNFELDF